MSLSPPAHLFLGLAWRSALLLPLPAVLATVVLRRPLRALGLTLGAPRAWWPWLVGLLALGVPFALALSRVPQVHATYPLLREARTSGWWFLASTAAFAVFGFSWEFFFRGFLLWGLAPRLGRLAIAAQAVPCALLHVGKPAVEVAASLPAALIFGALAYRARSIVPGWILHTLLSLTVNVACVVW